MNFKSIYNGTGFNGMSREKAIEIADLNPKCKGMTLQWKKNKKHPTVWFHHTITSKKIVNYKIQELDIPPMTERYDLYFKSIGNTSFRLHRKKGCYDTKNVTMMNKC